MPNQSQDKTGGTLEFSDMIDPANPHRQTDTTPKPTPPAEAPAASAQPDNQSLAAGTSSAVADDPTPVPASATPADNKPADKPSLPVFRNPLAANTQSHLAEFGAPASKGKAVSATTPAKKTALPTIRVNLSPLFDTFVMHGMKAEKGRSKATTLMGKIALQFKLNQVFSKRHMRYAGVGLFSFALFLLIFNFQTITAQFSYLFSPTQPSAPIATPVPVQVAASTANQAEAAPPGNVVIIPKIKVNAPINLEPSISEAAIQKSLQTGVVHYAGTAIPGERSNIAIFGHSSNDWWEPGNYKFVFALLDKMVIGDQIQINYEGKKYVYQVASTKVVEPTEISVLQPTKEPQLTLITCTPPGTSWKRLIVVAKQIAPVPDVPQATPQLAAADETSKAALPGNAPSLIDTIKSWFGLGPKPETPAASPAPATPIRNYLPAAA